MAEEKVAKLSGKDLWKKLITELVEKEVGFDLVNGVLCGRFIADDVKGLWFWFGEIKVVHEGKDKAGDMLVLESYELTKNEEGKWFIYLFTKEEGC